MTPGQMPFAEQIANIAPFIADAARHVCPPDVSAEDVGRLAVERFSGIGALEHGDAMFHLTALELLAEEVAEYADAVIYRARRMAIAAAMQPFSRSPLTAEQAEELRDRIRAAYEQPQPLVLLTEAGVTVSIGGYHEGNRAEALHPPQGENA